MTASLHFTDELNQIDFEHVTHWLSASYWSPGISQAIVEKGARHSTVVVGVFIDGKQVAYGRAISDTTRFAYVADVVVDEAFRQQGIATALMNYLIHHPKLDQVEQQMIMDALKAAHNNRTAAARLLGVTFRSLRYRMARLGMNE